MTRTFATSPGERCFEDYLPGAIYDCGLFTVTEQEIIQFATLYDPQVMHVHPTRAAEGPFGGIIASGWHTGALAMRLLVRNFLPENGLAAPGIDEMRWPAPVRPNDALTVQATVQEARRSRTKPDRGLIRSLIEVRNQDGDVVMSMRPINMVRVRNPVVEASA